MNETRMTHVDNLLTLGDGAGRLIILLLLLLGTFENSLNKKYKVRVIMHSSQTCRWITVGGQEGIPENFHNKIFFKDK